MQDHWTEYQRRRWMKPNAHLWMRPDAERWLAPNQRVWLGSKNWDAKYSPDQPRVPAGNPDGGQWTRGGQGDDPTRMAQADLGSITDAFGQPYYNAGGHHEMPRGIFEKWNLRPETRQVFNQATTGTIPQILLRTSPLGEPQGHFWDGPGGAHFNYNEAVNELSANFLEANGITPEQMTPDNARALLKQIRESQDPRIRDFNNLLRLLRRLFPLRTGRGQE